MTEPKFWTCEQDAEELTADSIEEAVEAWVWDQEPGLLPETVTVYGFAHIEGPSPSFMGGYLLENLLESLDEDYGSPDESTEPTEGMKAAEEAFVAAVLKEYRVWRCEEVTRMEVRVRDYITEEAA